MYNEFTQRKNNERKKKLKTHNQIKIFYETSVSTML